MKKRKKRKRKNHLGCLGIICWIIIPLTVITLLILDGLGLYCFNILRLIVIGACIAVALLPFFSEITVKDISIKTNRKQK